MAENKTVDKEKYLDEIEDSIRTIGVLTSGGDAPGMNAAIRAVVRRALAKGLKVRGIRRGYHGLLKEEIIDMSARDVSDIIERGGTVLQTARCKTMRTEEGQQKAAAICKKYGIDGLVVIGGDGSFAGAQKLANLGVNTIGIPGDRKIFICICIRTDFSRCGKSIRVLSKTGQGGGFMGWNSAMGA